MSNNCIKIYTTVASPYAKTTSALVNLASPYSELCLLAQVVGNFLYQDSTPFLFMNGVNFDLN